MIKGGRILMKKKIIGIFVCMLLIIATVIPVAGNLKIKYAASMAINTYVNEISPYLVTTSPLIITATGPSDLNSVTLYYRWSKDNASWTGIQQYSIFEGFENSGQNSSLWNTYQTSGSSARIRWNYGGDSHSGFYSCAMDDFDSGGDYALNVIYTNLDFSDAEYINLDFWQREWGDEEHNAPGDSWTGWSNYDAVAFTNDFSGGGTTWYEIFSASDLNYQTFTNFQYNISQDPDYLDPPNSNFAIAFQQYDNAQIPNDGRAWDDITIEYSIGAGINWTFWNDFSNPDQYYPWMWHFDFPYGAGYYEFFSVGKKTGEPDESFPLEADARCRFNQKPDISNEYPTDGSTDVELIPTLEITINDADGETMDLDWYSNVSGTWQSFGSNTDVEDGTYNQTNEDFDDFDTTYWWYVTVTDDINTVSSPIFEFTTYENLPPNTPSNPNPGNGETNVNIDIPYISWVSNDPNGDDVTFDVYFGKSNPPPKKVSHQSGNTYNPGLLDFDTTYYWKIVAWDEYDYSSTGPTWSFSTEDNLPPNTPSDPSPANGATDVSIEKILKWTGGDPNSGDMLTYEVYFGTSSPPPLVGSVTQPAFDPGTMSLGTIYYWQIVTEDSGGLEASGPIWQFTTQLEPNDPPSSPDIYGPPLGSPGKQLCWAVVSNDPDENQIKYIIDWGDENTFETDYYQSGLAVEACHSYNTQGSYTIIVKAEDDKGLVSEESTFQVKIKRTKSFTRNIAAFDFLLLRFLEKYPLLQILFMQLGLL
ncbi:hypothetical protein AYK24_05345 [Thermoplasmatales archaeon SG8-52-4]|nr:MAG: hypothetical protein AYK24_05345 [Thermoplasmatales archaeon SG8-52-4]